MFLSLIICFVFLISFPAGIKGEGCGKNCECGISKNIQYCEEFNKDRVLGGDDSDPQDWPFIVQLSMGTQRCTGTVISNQWILSAAHCEPDLNVTVLINDVWYEIKEVISHKAFDNKTGLNDIALLQLKKPLEFSENVSSICIHRNLTVPPMEIGVVAGFGVKFVRVNTLNNTYQEGLSSNDTIFDDSRILHETPVIIRDLGYCSDSFIFVRSNENEGSVICAGGVEHGTTQGDSGGPLMVIREHRWIQYGITSYGFYFPIPGDLLAVVDHGIYTKVSAYCDWIEDKTSQEVTCQ